MVKAAALNLGNGLSQLQQAITRWQLIEDGLPFQTPTSVLQYVLAQGYPAILKVALCAEERRGAALLRWWDGAGAVRVLAAHENVALLERACGHWSLAEMARSEQDDEASRIICGVVARLHMRQCVQSDPASPALVPLTEWFSALFAAGKTRGGLFQKTARVANDLLATPQDAVALHGDVHHDNILDAGQRGWLAIDPKGLVGERGFDFANLFCNPDHHTVTQPGRLARQVNVVSEAAGLEPQRLLAWIAAWAGLSATWHLEDGGSPETALAVAEQALYALRGSHAIIPMQNVPPLNP